MFYLGQIAQMLVFSEKTKIKSTRNMIFEVIRSREKLVKLNALQFLYVLEGIRYAQF